MAGTMRYVPPAKPSHDCAPPMRDVMIGLPSASLSPPGGPPAKVKVSEEPDAPAGAVWQCDGCGQMWAVATVRVDPRYPDWTDQVWRPARWYERRRARRAGAV